MIFLIFGCGPSILERSITLSLSAEFSQVCNADQHAYAEFGLNFSRCRGRMIEVSDTAAKKSTRTIIIMPSNENQILFQHSAHDHTQLSFLHLSSTVRPSTKQIMGNVNTNLSGFITRTYHLLIFLLLHLLQPHLHHPTFRPSYHSKTMLSPGSSR